MTSETVHATAVVIQEGAVLIRGEPGAGKSTLAREILALAAARGLFARLVGDDRVRIEARYGRLIARAHPATAGLIEVRGAGLLRLPHVDSALVRLVVDLVPTPERLPEAGTVRLCGVDLPLLSGAGGPGLAEALVGGWGRLAGVEG